MPYDVSILVFVDLAFEAFFCCVVVCSKLVSILVFVDLAFEVQRRLDILLPGPHVSILVFVDLAFEVQRRLDILLPGPHVSILVFVDLAFEVEADITSIWSSLRFNPCFRGSSFRSTKYSGSSRCASRVSILVFVDLAFEENPVPHQQSSRNLIDVSILVFVDLAFEAYFVCPDRSNVIWFQSLFSWI